MYLRLIALALVPRLVWLFLYSYDTTGVDVGRYLAHANSLREFHVFGFNGQPSAMSSPLYPAIIALLNSVILVQIVQLIVSIGTVLITYQIAKESFSKRVAVISAIGMALAPMSSRYSVVLLTETFFTFFIALGCLLWGRKKYYWSGAAFGLSILTRATSLPFVLLLIPLSFIPSLRHTWKIALVALLIVSPWTVRNYVVFHKFIPVVTAGLGNNLLVGTVNLTYEESAWTQLNNSKLLSEDEIKGLDETEVDRLATKKAIEHIKANPIGWMWARIKQYPLLYVDTGQYIYIDSGVLKTVVMPLFLLGNFTFLLLALYGFWLQKNRFFELAHLVLFPLFVALIHLPLWVEGRYSLPMMPMAVIFAAVAVCVGMGRSFRKPFASLNLLCW
jgi:4-amino-4-deoxy-L-arabinose transferase-like glycosyltransferase